MSTSSRAASPHKRIIAAAKALMVAHGYTATSMDKVAHRARVSKTTLYKRYPSKTALFSAVVQEWAELTAMEFREDELAALPIDEALFKIGNQFIDMVYSHEAMRLELIYQSEIVRAPEVAAAFRRGGPEHAITLVENYLREARQRGLIAVPDPHFAAVQFLVSMKGDPYGLASIRGIDPSPESKAAYIKKVIDLFLNGARPRT